MATYKIIGKRYLRKYTAETATPVYAAVTDAAKVAASLCDVPWEAVAARQATMPVHGDDAAVDSRDIYDAALFCGEHSGDTHRAYANAAVYRYVIPDSAVGAVLSSLAVKVTSDPYNSAGVRLHLFTNSTGVVPTSCADIRGNGSDGQPLTDGTTAAAVAPRETKDVSGKTYWYPVSATETISPTGGLTFQKYLFLAVVLEDYSISRANWLEGSAFIENAVSLTTAAAVTGWTDGETYDLSESAETEFKVVEGGVIADLPSGGVSSVRSLTLQRTGDEFALTHTGMDTVPAALYSRTRVAGIRTLLISGSSATFATPFFSGEAKNVSVFPAKSPEKTYVLNGTVVEDAAKYTTVAGDFASGTFPDLPGLFIVSTTPSTGVNATLASSNTLASVVSDTAATVLADIKSDISANGGIRSSCFQHVYAESTTTSPVVLCTKRCFPVVSSGYFGNQLSACLSGGKTSSVGVSVSTLTDCGGEAVLVPSQLYDSTYNTVGIRPYSLVHDAASKKISVFSAAEGVPEISYSGTVTAIRPMFVAKPATDSSALTGFVVSGDLESVYGTPCKNVAIVTISKDGKTAKVIVPDCDALITPDSYQHFAVSVPVCGGKVVMDEFYVTGGFTTLGGKACEIVAHVSGTTVTPISLPEGTRPPEYFLFCDAAGSTAGASAFWVDAQSGSADFTTYAAPKSAVTDAQSAFGLRRLYAGLYAGLTARTLSTDGRIGAAFTVRGDTISVRTGNGDSDVTSAKCWNVSEAVLPVPFSCPRDYAARKVKLEWGATAATDGACVRVWLKRGEFLSGAPDSVHKSLHFAAAKGEKVDGWEFVGTVTPTDGTAGEATFEFDPITDDVATLLFVAFASQDEFNPSADMTLPHGIGTLNVNDVTGTSTGFDGGFKPDITLIG